MSAGYDDHVKFTSEGRAAAHEAIRCAAMSARLQAEVLKRLGAPK